MDKKIRDRIGNGENKTGQIVFGTEWDMDII